MVIVDVVIGEVFVFIDGVFDGEVRCDLLLFVEGGVW